MSAAGRRSRAGGRIHVVRAGLLTTVQDLGRYGHQRFGMPVAGAMDPLALRLANRLVGNDDHAAGLEITIQGPELLFETPAVIALAGADLGAALDRQPLPLWTSVAAPAGSRLSFGRPRSGARAYLAVAGGLDVPLVLGSRGTHLASRTGGLEGRGLVAGDVLPVGAGRRAAEPGLTVPSELVPRYGPVLRIVEGPSLPMFAPEARAALTADAYLVLPESNRAGYRLHGASLSRGRSGELLSEAVPLGALQVPADGQPILLMADHPTTGGYPVIAVVASIDVPQAAQRRPGEIIRFQWIELQEARRLARDQARALKEWRGGRGRRAQP